MQIALCELLVIKQSFLYFKLTADAVVTCVSAD